MRVIARNTLTGYVTKQLDGSMARVAEQQLDVWYKETRKATWKTPADIKSQSHSASILQSQRVVFNIKGNDFRLVAKVNYRYAEVRVLWLGTHAEYDKIDVMKVEFDRSRYGD